MNPKALKNKKYAQRFHAKKRAAQRFGLDLTTDKQRQIVRLIQLGKGRFVKHESNSRSHWVIEWEGQLLRVVYDKVRKELVTVLPKEAL